MRFVPDPEVEAFRSEVRAFIDQELPAEDVRAAHAIRMNSGVFSNDYGYLMGFQRKLAARGWLALAWPERYGGLDADFLRQVVYNEEMAYSDAPSGNMGIAWVGPTLMLYGSEDLKERYVSRIARGEDWWCTLYSEPIAGSDLAAMQTRAVRDGDSYRIRGQKIWTSGGHNADWGWLAARTDPDAPKHKGITLFAVDMRSPGISIRPLVNLANHHHFNEVFFDDVVVPGDQVVGEVNRGWYYLAVALDFERSGIQSFAYSRRHVDRMAAELRENPARAAVNPSIRHEVADRAIESSVGRLLAYRVALMQAAGEIANHEASASKLFGSELTQRVHHTGMHILGMAGQLDYGSAGAKYNQAANYLEAVAATVAAGTSEIQRGIIATRGLGLPR